MKCCSWLMMALLAVAAPTAAYGAPGMMTYQGNLVNSLGEPLSGSFNFIFSIYPDSVGGSPVWAEGHPGVVVNQGKFSVVLGTFNPIPDGIFGGNAFLQIVVGTEILSPRTRLTTHPYSFRVQTVDGASGGLVTGTVVIHPSGVKVPEDMLRMEEADGDPLMAAAVDVGVSTVMSFYDPVDSKTGMANVRTAEYGSDAIVLYHAPGDTALSYLRGKRLKVFSHGARGGIFLADSTGSWGGWFQGHAGGVAAVCLPTGTSSYSGVSGNASGGAGYNYGLWGMAANSNQSFGVYGTAQGSMYNYGVRGYATGGTMNYGVYGEGGESGEASYAGYFVGNVLVTGTLTKGGGAFKIDHPLDPENKYLYHSFVESPDMKNVYDGVVRLDGRGEATVVLPEYFETLNRDFRYQLTPVGAAMPDLHILQKVEGNQFQIGGGAPGMEVSWQVTGIRQDPFANANRIPVEELKKDGDRGKYLHPGAYGLEADRRIGPGEAKPAEVPMPESEE